MKIYQSISLAVVFSASLVCSCSVAYALPIISLSGSHGTGPGGLATGSMIPFAGGGLGNSTDTGMAVTPYAPGAYSVSDATVNLSMSGGGQVSITTPIVITETGTGFTAVFNVLGTGTLTVVPPQFATIAFPATVQLVSNGTSLELGTLGSFWDYGFTLNGLVVTPGNPGNFTVFNSGSSSGSFTLGFIGSAPPFGVPEPTSMLAWGLIVLAGGTYRLRSRRRSKTVA